MLASVPKRATQKNIAAQAGVRRSTVSLILNGRGDNLRISPQTQARVLEIARKLGYRPNSLAMGLAGKRTQTIGLLLPSGSTYPEYLLPQELSLRLYREGYQTYLVDTLHDHNVILESLVEMASRRVDGIVLFTPNHILFPKIRQALNQFSVTVLLSHEPLVRDTLRSHLVYGTLEQGANEMIGHFVRTGRRRPLMATTIEFGNQSKIRAFKNALSRHGFDSGDEVAVFGIPEISVPNCDYYSYFMKQFELQNLAVRDFDAVFCTRDEGALAAINYLKDHGRRVPEDVAVVGLNDAPWIRAFRPPLASISWRHVDTCDLVMKRLRQRLKEPDMEPGCDEVPTGFIRRESAG